MRGGMAMMNFKRKRNILTGLAMLLVLLVAPMAGAYDIPGITGTSPNPAFNLITGTSTITTGDGNSVYMWLYGVEGGVPQYPGPTIIVNQGDTVTINLKNRLPVPTSLVVDGITVVATASFTGTDLPGLLTREVAADNGASSVAYTFTASQPGTYLYHSGTNPPLQVEMGLLGAIIVRPAGFGPAPNRTAYGHADSAYVHEKLFLLTDVDVRVHDKVQKGNYTNIDFTDYHDVYWFINGRTLPDTLSTTGALWLRNQPYDAFVMMNPGQTILYRMVNASRDPHPLHTHGNHHLIIGRQGRFLSTGAGADLSSNAFTTVVYPGDTVDAIMSWRPVAVGWDVVGHGTDVDNPPLGDFPGPGDIDNNNNGILDSCAAQPAEPWEDPADHCKLFPLKLPSLQDLTFGQFWGGSPFLGALGALPPGEGGFNPWGGFFFMQHSHNEKELTNNNIFPGGMATFLVVIAPSTMIVE
jgi:FtsP/CotA-like multicopper oxidase with cupredoxin domain